MHPATYIPVVPALSAPLVTESAAEGVPVNHDTLQEYLKVAVEQGAEIFQLIPRKKCVGPFKGDLWLDVQTRALVHEARQFVKSPSLFIKRTNFVRDFETRNGLATPMDVHIVVNTCLAGPATMEIHLMNLRRESHGCASDYIRTPVARTGDTSHAN
jgi:hypothetical protein